jgi:hypothetical protein
MLGAKVGHTQVKIDDAILEELARARGTAKDIGERLAARVQVDRRAIRSRPRASGDLIQDLPRNRPDEEL